MEDGFHLPVGQQRGLVPYGLGHVADHETQMGNAGFSAVRRFPYAQVVHPRSGALGVPRMPVRIKGTQVFPAFRIMQFIEQDVRMPHLHRAFRRFPGFTGLERHRGTRRDRDAVQAGVDGKEPFHDFFHGVIRAQVFLVKSVQFAAAFFRPVSGFPRGELFHGFSCFFLLVPANGFHVLQERGLHPVMQVVDEFQGVGSAPGHAAGSGVIRKAAVPQQMGFPVPQFQDFSDKGFIIVFSALPDGTGALPHAAAQAVRVRKLHDRLEGGEFLGEAPAGGFFRAVAVGQGIQAGGFLRGIRQPGKFRFIFHNEFPGVGGVQHVFREFLGLQGELGFYLRIFRLHVVRQVRPALAEVRQRFLDETLPDGGKAFHPVTGGRDFQHRPQARVQRHGGGESHHFRQHFPYGLPLGGFVIDGVQVHDTAPAQVQILGGLFQSAEGAFISQGLQRLVANGPDILFGAGDGFRDVRPDGLRRKPGPGNQKGGVQIGMVHIA